MEPGIEVMIMQQENLDLPISVLKPLYGITNNKKMTNGIRDKFKVNVCLKKEKQK